MLIYLNKAELVTDVKNSFLRSVTCTYPMPSIIRLNKYAKVPYKGVVLSRQNIFKRDGYTCQYCGSCRNLTLDHVVPRSRGGNSTWKNLVTACKNCNSKKGSMTPKEAGMPLQERPFKPTFLMFMRDFSGSVDTEWKMFLGKKR